MSILAESKMDDKEVLKAAKSLAKNGKDEKTKSFGQGLVDYYKENNSFTPNQVSGLQNIMKNASFQMAKEDTDVLDEDHDDMGNSYELEESFSVFKPMSPAPGRSVSNRVQVKAFKTSDAMNAFLAKGDNALHWKPTDKSGLKSGKYKMNMKRGSDGKPARDFIREETNDDVSTADFINHVENEDFVEAKDAFDALIHQKAYEHIRSTEAEIAAKMFESTSREKRDFKRREMEVELGDESANNVSITIDGKLWKVIPGESENPTRALARADKMANTIKRNATAKGRKVPKVDVRVTGLKPTETSGSSKSARLWR